MQNPILQDKRQEHVSFQKYALELLESVSGRTKPSAGPEFEVSLANIHRVCDFSDRSFSIFISVVGKVSKTFSSFFVRQMSLLKRVSISMTSSFSN